MKKMVNCTLLVAAFLFAACADPNPFPYIADGDIYTDKESVEPAEKEVLPETENDLPDTVESEENNDDGTVIAPDDDVPSGNCKLDSDCGAPYICVKAKCVKGCESAADCTNYANTTCNTKLGRCLNTIASEGACNEANCASGCCYADKGFLELKCLTTATLSACGICAQGEVYMNGSQCVPAACKVGETKCQTYNSYSQRAKCFECGDTEHLCADNESTNCSGGSALMMVNVMECVPAGESCSGRDTCCSGMPCIQGYCY